MQREARERMPQVVRRDTHIWNMDAPNALTPNVPIQNAALFALHNELVIGRQAVIGKVSSEARQDRDRARLPRFRRNDLAELCGLVNVDHAVPNTACQQSADLARAKAGIRDQAHDDLVSRCRHCESDSLNVERSEWADQFAVMRHAAHVSARIIVNHFVLFGGCQCCAEDARCRVDRIVRRAESLHVAPVRLDAALRQVADANAAEHRIDPLVAEEGALMSRADTPLARVVREPFLEPLVKCWTSRRARGVRGWNDPSRLNAGLYGGIELNGILVRREAARALFPVCVAVRNAPRGSFGIGSSVDAHGGSLVTQCCQVVVRWFKTSYTKATANAKKREEWMILRPELMRVYDPFGDCYDPTYRGRSSVGRATASQSRRRARKCCQVVRPSTPDIASSQGFRAFSKLSLASLTSLRCCQVCCQVIRLVASRNRAANRLAVAS